MTKSFSKKKMIIASSIVAAIVIVSTGSIIGVNAYNNYVTNKAIATSKSDIDKAMSEFSSEADRNKKLTILETTEKDSKTYDNSQKASYDEVEVNYSSIVEEMRNYFIDEYETAIKENTISDIDNEKDKDKIKKAKDNLNNLSETMVNDKKVVFYTTALELQYDNYIYDINVITETYDARIKAIEKAEAEAKAKEEAAKKATEPTTKKADKKNDSKSESSSNNESSSSSDNNYNDNNNYNYGGSESNNSNSYDYNYNYGDNNSGGNNNYSSSSNNYSYWSYTNENGTSYHDSNGNRWHSNGNKYEYDPDDDINSWGYPDE